MAALASPFDGYVEWCTASLGAEVSPKLQVRDVPPSAAAVDVLVGEGERGVYATAAIAADETLVSMPFSSLFTVASPLQCPPELKDRAMLLVGALGRLGREDDALAVRLLFEKNELGPHSKWARHIAVIPESYPHTPHEWEEDELELLRGSSVHTLAVHWRGQVQADYAALAGMGITPDGAQTLGDAFSWFTLDAYRWALLTLWTRCCSVVAPHPQTGQEQLFKVRSFRLNMILCINGMI